MYRVRKNYGKKPGQAFELHPHLSVYYTDKWGVLLKGVPLYEILSGGTECVYLDYCSTARQSKRACCLLFTDNKPFQLFEQFYRANIV